MKKRISKLLALLMCLAILPLSNILSVSAAESTAVTLTKIVGYDGQDGTLPTVDTSKGTIEIMGDLPDKNADDKGFKMGINAGQTANYANLNIFDSAENTTAISARTVVFDVYPNNTVDAIQFRGRATKHPNYEITLSNDIPMSAFEENRWNKVKFVYNPSGANSIYINNAFYASNNTHFTAPSTSSKLTYAYIRLYAKTAAADGAYINLDNIQTAKGAAAAPDLKSGKYIIDSEIHEYGENTTVKDVLDNITYNGTAIAVKNAAGEDITNSPDTVVAKGDSVHIYDGEIETGLYYFGEHKPLVALNDNAGTIMSSGFDKDSNNFSLNNATAATEEGTAYGKPAGDKVLNVSGTNTSYYAYRTTKPEDRTKVSTISFEVYPNGTWTRLDISTNSGAYFLRLPADRLKTNEWNQITLFVGGDKTSRPNTVYVNGDQIENENGYSDPTKIYIHASLFMGNTAASGHQLRIGVSGAESVSNLIIDNFYQAEGQALIPSLTSQSYEIDGMLIKGYAGASASEVMADITYNGSKAVIINNDGTDITGTAEVIASGNHLYIYDGDFITGHYVFKGETAEFITATDFGVNADRTEGTLRFIADVTKIEGKAEGYGFMVVNIEESVPGEYNSQISSYDAAVSKNSDIKADRSFVYDIKNIPTTITEVGIYAVPYVVFGNGNYAWGKPFTHEGGILDWANAKRAD